MTALAREKFPNVPIVLGGHSMGSFIARAYLSRYPDEKLCGALISGTSGALSATALGKAIAKFYMRLYGENYRSVFLKNLSFSGYNKRYPHEGSPFSWISSDKAIVDKYEKDEYCQFVFTVRAYYDLFSLLEEVSTVDWASKLKPDLPIFLISGCDDPVGQYGRGVCQVYERMKNTGMSNLSIKVYSGMRHEILNEREREKVYRDIIKWLDKIINE
jgi:alpha-beta hydrolase superfamily lysophospholipase